VHASCPDGWSVEALRAELTNDLPACFLLTNSRSLSLPEAQALNTTIGHNLQEAARDVARRFVVVSRSDSTLRGHFPGEVEALAEASPRTLTPGCSCLFFQEGGRYTIDDVHYVAEGSGSCPAAETESARDACLVIRPQTCGSGCRKKLRAIPAQTCLGCRSETSDVADRSSDDAPHALTHGCVCVVNAASQPTSKSLCRVVDAEARGRRFLYRTAASFVPIRADMRHVRCSPRLS